VRPKDQARGKLLEAKLLNFDAKVRPLLGIKDPAARAVLLEQIIESIRRIEFVHLIGSNPIEAGRADPHSSIFDPIRAAILRMRSGDYDEAYWLIFLFVHFGKHEKDGWRLVRDIYGAFGGNPWTWARVSANPGTFQQWLQQNEGRLKGGDGVSRRFGNHRKYETLSSSSANGTAAVIASYVAWIGPPNTHRQKIQDAHKEVGQNPREVFDYLYKSMNSVRRFGRLAKFDYLTMLGKIGLAPIEPGSAYLKEATGPLDGARLLVTGSTSGNATAAQLESILLEIDAHLNVGMQVLEDALCNWQKSPTKFVSFRG
jgi:hypothetical protein